MYDSSILPYTSVTLNSADLKKEGHLVDYHDNGAGLPNGDAKGAQMSYESNSPVLGMFPCTGGCDYYVLLSGLDVLETVLNKARGSALFDCVL